MIKTVLFAIVTDRTVQVTGATTGVSVIFNLIVDYSKTGAAVFGLLTSICLFITAFIAAKNAIKNKNNQEKDK